MSPSHRPTTRNGKSRLMDPGSTRAPGSRDASQPPTIPMVLLQSDALHNPPPAQDPKLALFKQLVMIIERSNAMKKQLNSYQQGGESTWMISRWCQKTNLLNSNSLLLIHFLLLCLLPTLHFLVLHLLPTYP